MTGRKREVMQLEREGIKKKQMVKEEDRIEGVRRGGRGETLREEEKNQAKEVAAEKNIKVLKCGNMEIYRLLFSYACL